jgi:tRNA(fMet)-specific endonuclease VapC
MLDTNAYVALKRGKKEIIEIIHDSEKIIISIIVVGELLFGFHHGKNYEKNIKELDAFLSHPDVQLIYLTWESADRFGRLATALKMAGSPIPLNDLWIASQALETGAELITYDKHFCKIAGLSLKMLTTG